MLQFLQTILQTVFNAVWPYATAKLAGKTAAEKKTAEATLAKAMEGRNAEMQVHDMADDELDKRNSRWLHK